MRERGHPLAVRTLLIVLALLGITGLASDAPAALKYDPKLLAYTPDKKGFAEGDLDALFTRLLRDTKPLVIFIHGRGDEPSKSLEGPIRSSRSSDSKEKQHRRWPRTAKKSLW